MRKRHANIMLIGLGVHAKRIWYPIYQRDSGAHRFKIAYVVDLEEKKQDIAAYLASRNEAPPIYGLACEDVTYDELLPHVRNRLDDIVRDYQIAGVLLATEPLSHPAYVRWALRKGLSILIDKPISTHENIATTAGIAHRLVDDYEGLMALYGKAKAANRPVLCSVVTQRRYHPVFRKAKAQLREVFQKTNCPVTSIQSFHADGQWRMPAEIIDIDYHPFNRGYGKCSHSGYHFFDIVPWLLEAAEGADKRIDNVDVVSTMTTPQDFFSQLRPADYERLFRDYAAYNKYDDQTLHWRSSSYGEIDAFNSFAFKQRERIITLGSINLVHNGFSQRGWVSAQGRDLYKGNGRLRHESHFIEQGPFQALSLVSYQSKEVDPGYTGDVYDVGGEYHFDLHVFRNSSLFKEWKAYERFSVKELGTQVMEGTSRGHQEDARRRAMLEFVRYLTGEDLAPVSDLSTHWRGVQLMYGVYHSAVQRRQGANPVVNIAF
jgi:predicted dehydrogenase